MSWYDAGTVTVTQGSNVVDGAGCNFIPPNVLVGFGFVDEAGLMYQVIAIESATRLRIKPAYRGATGAGRSYQIQPTQEFLNALALRAQAMVDKYDMVLDGVGRGLFGDGTAGAPGVRFTADQNTGVRRVGEDTVALVAGGVDAVTAGIAGAVVRGGLTLNRLNGGTIADGLIFGGGGNAYGIYPNANDLVMRSITGGVDLATFTYAGNIGFGTTTPVSFGGYTSVTIGGDAHGLLALKSPSGQQAVFQTNFAGAGIGVGTASAHPLLLVTDSIERARFDTTGNLLVGATSSIGGGHRVSKAVTQGYNLLVVDAGGVDAVTITAVSGTGYNPVGTALYVNKNDATNRSVNAAGTINASGADYAEYIRKADGCGAIAKGDVCGIDRHGLLTRQWSTAVRFVVKSTDPNLVGGDSWGAHLGPRPETPAYEAPAYDGPAEPVRPEAPAPDTAPEIALPVRPIRAEGESDDDFTDRVAAYMVERGAALAAIYQAGAAEAESAAAQARYVVALRQYNDESAAYDAARRAYDDVEAAAVAAHDEAVKAHAVTLAAWEADLEAARQPVDRIAFCGQVPVNVDADTLAACEAALADGVAVYLVAIARGAGIGVTAVREGDMTLPQYMRRVGCVWAIRDGRPWVDVQHG